MTVYKIKPELEPALIEFGRVLCRASIFFLKNLADIVEVTCLREGDAEYDYFLEVPEERFDVVSRHVSDLLGTVRETFGIDIGVKLKRASPSSSRAS